MRDGACVTVSSLGFFSVMSAIVEAVFAVLAQSSNLKENQMKLKEFPLCTCWNADGFFYFRRNINYLVQRLYFDDQSTKKKQ